MQVYLPIAELSVNAFGIVLLGGVTGILSGMFGVGGGFLTTPFLIFIGVSPAVAVATSANQIIASSFSGFLSQLRRRNVDFQMGCALLAGGVVGSSLGVALFQWLKSTGDIDVIISVVYVVFLTLMGGVMAVESFRAVRRIPPRERKPVQWRDKLPWQMDFERSGVRLSVWLPLGIGFCVGILVSLMGIGGGFFLLPAMIYVLRMPTPIAIGTSLFQIIFITANVTFLQAVTTQTVDVLLALLLLSGSVLGAQLGTKIGARIPAEHLRGLLAALVLGVAVKLASGLVVAPENLFTVTLE